MKIDVSRSLFVHKSPGGYMHRVGSAKREMAPDYLARLFQQRSQARIIRFDEQPVPGAVLDDLAHALWQRFASPREQDAAMCCYNNWPWRAQMGMARLRPRLPAY